jgi:predicted aconitase with swiveling domain
VLAGEATGEAVVSRLPFDALASFKRGLQSGESTANSSDERNTDIFGARLTGSVLCVPVAVGSTSAGTTWDLISVRRLEPAAILFAGVIDSLSAGGLIVARVWNGSRIVVVDGLGDEFLDAAYDGAGVRVACDGSVVIG